MHFDWLTYLLVKLSPLMRQWHKGKKLSEEHKRNIAKASSQHSHSEETRKKLREINKGRVFSEETRQKMSESAKKKKLSEEHKHKISEAGKRRKPPSEETRKKLAESARRTVPGRKHSEETKRRMSETRKGKKRTVTEKALKAARKRGDAMIGRKQSPEAIEKFRRAMKGRIFSDEHRENLSKSGKGKHSGINAPNYIDGRTKERYPYPPEFTDYLKKKVRNRDKYTCQCCFNEARGRKGHVHHIDGAKPNCEMDNLVLVCTSCHNKIHSYSPDHSERVVYFRNLLKPENRPLRASI